MLPSDDSLARIIAIFLKKDVSGGSAGDDSIFTAGHAFAPIGRGIDSMCGLRNSNGSIGWFRSFTRCSSHRQMIKPAPR